MTELQNLILSAQQWDKDSMQKIIETFTPMIGKYTKMMNYNEDFKSEMILHLIETVHAMDLSKFRILNDYSIIAYIKNSLHHRYISLSKKQSTERKHENQFEDQDIETWLGEDYSAADAFDDLTIDMVMRKTLTDREYSCVKLMALQGMSSSDAARILGISRQTANEAKLRGLKKLLEVLECRNNIRN